MGVDKYHMETRTVTVITPTYNRSRRVLECIESVRRQTHPAVEHIVIDDGSTDGTVDRIQKTFPDLIRSGRLRLIRQENAGPGSARNAGLGAARGEFITYLDSDDLFLDSHAARLVRPMLVDEGVGITYANHVEKWYSPEGAVVREKAGPLEAVNPLDIRFKNRIPIMYMHQKSLVDQIGGFDTDRLGLEDWDFLIRLSEVARLEWVPAVTAIWRHLSADPSITGELRGEMRESKYRKVLKKTLRRELDGQILEPALRDGIEALNRAIFGQIVEAAQNRPKTPEGFAGQIAPIKLEKILPSELDSLLELIRRHFKLYHPGLRPEVVLPTADTPAVEWIGKLNRLLESAGLQTVMVSVPQPLNGA